MSSGCLIWAYEADAGVRSTPVVGGNRPLRSVYFGDANANAYALDMNGKLRWRVKIDMHPDAMITGAVAHTPGSVSALDAGTGKVIWTTYTIADAPQKTTKAPGGTQLWGPSGGGVWSTPAIDVPHNRMSGGSMNGPGSTIVNGTLFVSSGYGSLGFMPGNVLLAFSVEGK